MRSTYLHSDFGASKLATGREEGECEAALLTKLFGNQITEKEMILTQKRMEIENTTDLKKRIGLESEISKLNKEISTLRSEQAAEITKIDNKNRSSIVILGGTQMDSLPDANAKFYDTDTLVTGYTTSNLAYINDNENGLYSGDTNPPKYSEVTVGNPPHTQLVLDGGGVINLGTQQVNQHVDYKESITIFSDSKEVLPHGKFDPETGLYKYVQSGGNTCQSYTLQAQMLMEGVKFRDNETSGRQLIHELTRMQYQMGETGYMSSKTLEAYNKLVSPYGLKATDITEKYTDPQDRQNAIKDQLRQGKIVNSGMYLDAPPAEVKLDAKGEIKEPTKGHRVNIVGFDDARGEWIVNDSNQSAELVRIKYGDYELGNRWSTILEKK